MISFPELLTYPAVGGSGYYAVYSTSPIESIVCYAEDEAFSHISLIGPLGENLYKIFVSCNEFEFDGERQDYWEISTEDGEIFGFYIWQCYDNATVTFNQQIKYQSAPNIQGQQIRLFATANADTSGNISILDNDGLFATSGITAAWDSTNQIYNVTMTGTLTRATDSPARWFAITCNTDYLHSIYEWFLIIQNEEENFPVWKDTYFSPYTDDDYVDYTLSVYQESYLDDFFSARAYKMPGTDQVEINLNKILEYYVPSNFNCKLDDNFWQKDTSSKDFILQSNGTPVAQFFTWNDYSYEDEETPAQKVLSRPVRNTIDSRQGFICSMLLNGANDDVMIEDAQGENIIWEDSPISTTGERGVYHYYGKQGDLVTGTYTVEISGDTKLTYVVKDTCCDFALIYLNKYGGYDNLIMEGACKRTDNWTNYSIKNNFKNTDKTAFGNRQYLKNITEKWTLNTGWMTDDEASRMDNLLESNRIFLQDLKTLEIYSVLITDTNLEFKTYQNQGRKLINYTINIQKSQNRIRR